MLLTELKLKNAAESACNEAATALSRRARGFTTDDLRALRILMEEVGEVSRAIGPEGGDLEEELLQVAAVAIMWVARLRKERS